MMTSNPDGEEFQGFDPFSAAERAAEEAIDGILNEGGEALYGRYIEQKSFCYAADVISNLLVQELRMCFVPFDRGEAGQRQLEKPSLDQDTTCAAVAAASSSSVIVPEVPNEQDARQHREGTAAAQEQAGGAHPDDDDDGVDYDLPPQPLPARDGWDLEEEPERSRIDTWARACVPIRRKLMQPKVGQPVEEHYVRRQTRKAPGSPKLGSTTSAGARSPSRVHLLNSTLDSLENAGAGANANVTATRTNGGALKSLQAVPLIEEREEDEEEGEMREKKEREARRRRDEESRVQQRASQEAEEAARLAQVKDQMKNKPFTYDNQGNIIWIQPPSHAKLPVAHPAPSYGVRKDAQAGHQTQTHDASPRPARAKLDRGGGKKEKEFSDSFKRFASQQPTMIDAMNIAPGVVLQERGKQKYGQQVEKKGQAMSRQEYEDMVRSGMPRQVQAEPESSILASKAAAAAAAMGGSAAASVAGAVPAAQGPAGGGGGGSATAAAAGTAAPVQQTAQREAPDEGHPSSRGAESTSVKVYRGPDRNSELIPHAPTGPRPAQPVPPPTFRRAQMKRDALGYSLSTRERANTGTNSRFPGCAPPPPPGATMGHGLGSGQRPHEFYIPGAAPSFGLGEEPLISEGEGSPSPQQGQIVSKNPKLVKQLFASSAATARG